MKVVKELMLVTVAGMVFVGVAHSAKIDESELAVSAKQAIDIAQAAVPGQIYAMELEKEDGTLAWEVELVSSKDNVEYEILQDGKTLAKIPGPEAQGRADRDSQIRTSLKLKNFKLGKYTLRITVNDRNAGQNIEKDVVFTVIQ